jgi:cytidylate kinase
MLSQLIHGGSSQDLVVKKMFHLMRTFALHGKVIFVGRGSTFLTRDLPLGIHVRLEAPMELRVKRMMSALGLDAKKTREAIDAKDKAKAGLVKIFFNKDIRDPLLYDVLWNTDRVSIDEIAKLLIEMIRDKAAGIC